MKNRLIWILVNKYGFGIKYKFLLLIIFSILNGFLEVLGIGLIFPLITLVSKPELIQENEYLILVNNFFGFESVSSMIYLSASLVGGTFILKNLFMILFQNLQFKLVKNWRDELSDMIMSKYLYAPYLFHLNESSSSLINNLSYTVPYIMNTYVISFVMLFANTIVVCMLLSIVVLLFPIPSLISGLVLGLLIYIQTKYIKDFTKKISKRVVLTRKEQLSVLTQSLVAIKETKSFVKEDFFLKKFNVFTAESSEQDQKSLVIQNIPAYANEVVLMTSVVIMCCMIIGQSDKSSFSVASLAVLAAIAFRVAPIVNRALRAYSQVKVSSDATLEFINQITELESISSDPAHVEAVKSEKQVVFKDSISLDNVSYSYDEKVDVLKNISLTIKKGSFVGFVGASGSGKTTLVDILLTLLYPKSGKYLIDNEALRPNAHNDLKKKIGYVGQQPYIFNGTILENVAFGVDKEDIDAQRVIESLRSARILDFFESKIEFLNFEIADLGKSLSGGQRQRVAFARALYNNPEIIILDEATSALDVETEKKITDVINSLKGKVTILAIAHRLSTLKECDEIVYMDDGKIIDSGSFKELESKHKTFSNLINLSSI